MTKRKLQSIENLQRIEKAQKDILGTAYSVDYDNVNMTIAEKDTMYQSNNDTVYQLAGKSALHNIYIALLQNGIDIRDVNTVLDFACGYGRVLRYLKLGFPSAKIYACECDEEALEFCEKTFHVSPILSGDPDNANAIELPEKIDLIWVGSLFTHFNAKGWKSFLDYFSSILNPNGILIFSSKSDLRKEDEKYPGIYPEGRQEIEQGFKNNGFGFAQYMHEIGGHTNYGLCVAKPGWVIDFVEKYIGLRLTSYAKRAWVLGHDLITCVKEEDLY